MAFKNTRNWKIAQTTNPPSVDPDGDMVLTIDFAEPPNDVIVDYPDLKYDKRQVLHMQKDDGGDGDYQTVFRWLHNGEDFAGNVVGAPYYTDGCGKPVKWGYGLAVYTLSSYQGKDAHDGSNNTYTYWPQYAEMARQRFTMVNHSYGSEYLNEFSADREYQIHQNEIKFFDELLKYGTYCRTRHLVVPASDEGYTSSAIASGYGTIASEFGNNSGDGYTNDLPFVTGFQVTEITKDQPYFLLKRANLGDNWDLEQSQNAIPNELTNFFNRMDSPGKWIHTLFSHGPGVTESSYNYFRQFTETVKNHPKNNDRIWIPCTAELYDWFETKRTAIKTVAVNGKRMTVTINLAGVSKLNQYRDLSLLIKGGQITAINAAGVDDFSFNTVSGLVNLFKKKVVFTSPELDARPAHIVSATHSGNTIALVFDKPITQNLKAGWTVTNAVVNSITGSDMNWTINLNRAAVAGDRLFYRMQNGDAVTQGSGLKVLSYISQVVL